MNDRINGAPGSNPDKERAQDASTASHATSGGTRARERIAALDTSAAAAAGQAEQIDELGAPLQAAVQRAPEAETGWHRARADFANLKRRVEEERSELAASASDRLLSRVLGLADD